MKHCMLAELGFSKNNRTGMELKNALSWNALKSNHLEFTVRTDSFSSRG